ncbi:TGF-beta-activated kinase 1 and MAP3K7-binding protein 3-like isoform X2 [Ornithodoros turicata]|uniref:TGF-beta-activated kinase 1 and MAP3K7-binding protein 3-like isoform X2 n=1 Tax=Ornithodoros turicata TaxID=34597 RepID=UPI0031394796
MTSSSLTPSSDSDLSSWEIFEAPQFPRNREECISQLTRASHEQLYSHHDSEEVVPGRELHLPSTINSSVLEPLPPPFTVDEADLPPPYPGVLSPVTDVMPQSTTVSATVPAFVNSPSSHHQVSTLYIPPRADTLGRHSPQQLQEVSTCNVQLARGNVNQRSPSPLPQYQSQVSIDVSPGVAGHNYHRRSSLSPSVVSLNPAAKMDDMVQALLAVQRHRYELLQRVYGQQLERLHKLRGEVEAKEAALMQKNLHGVSNSQIEELRELRRENRNLDVECHCLLSEVDMYNRGEIPLGVTDEDFYNRINPGQTGPIAPPPPVQLPQPRPQRPTMTSTRPGGGLLSEDEENEDGNRWKCSKCTFLNHPALDKCEVCELPNTAVSDRVYGLTYPAATANNQGPSWTTMQRHSLPAHGRLRIKVTRRVTDNQTNGVELCVQHSTL